MQKLCASTFLFMLTFSACSSQKTEHAQKHEKKTKQVQNIREIDVTTLYKIISQNSITLLDVRTPQEYAQAHVPSATSVPLQDLESQLSTLALKKNQDIYLICAVGGRSFRAAQKLQQLGYHQVINVRGGTRGWQEKGYPVE